MRFAQRKTVKKPFIIKGIGLHCGEKVSMTLRPAQAGSGVFFRRIDLYHEKVESQSGLAGKPIGHGDLSAISIQAHPRSVVDTRLGTTIANEEGVIVATIEHLMAALAICGVDDVIIDINGPEVPICDGSAEPFVDAIRSAGVSDLKLARDMLVVETAFEVRDGDRFIKIEPCDRFEIDVEIDFKDPAIGRQSVHLLMSDSLCQERMMLARTFCEFDTVKTMQAAGLGRGGSLDNAIVVDNGRLLNGDTLRDPQEFVLHKALDLVGDLALVGMPLTGRVSAFKPGHDLNTLFARHLVAREGVELCRQPIEQVPIQALAEVG